jgi:hypothetical protein
MGQLGFFDLNRRYESLIEKMYSPYSPVLRHSPLPHSTGPSPPTRLTDFRPMGWFFHRRRAAGSTETARQEGRLATLR